MDPEDYARTLQQFSGASALTPDEMAEHAAEASQVLKSIANPNRLMILCTLTEGEKSVGSINSSVPLSQSALSQHLARLRAENLVSFRKEGQLVLYRIRDPRIVALMSRLYELYCAPDATLSS
ncbi:ArsR/SmtB family transcription factor [Vreelandella utahensis]|uniref:ArsR/SmtB family transcription factor n=1 Tax=Vreelandella halophila TaxID=86177 RepID=UPI001C4E0CFC|nr:metalloregulator ArsR/SmtB family transcription factor [Halomonas utahensis]